jgi:hypothetical protein
MRKFIMLLLLTFANLALSALPAEAKKPITPTELKAVTSPEIPGAVELSWHAVKGVSKYTVSASRETAENWHDLGTTTATNFQVDELPEGTKYYFRVASNVSAAQSDWSGAIVQYSSKTKDSRPALLLPTNFRIGSRGAAGRTGELALTWNVVAGARSYVVQICDADLCTAPRSEAGTLGRVSQDELFRDLADVSGTEHLVTGLISGKLYFFRVMGLDSNGRRGTYSDVQATRVP